MSKPDDNEQHVELVSAILPLLREVKPATSCAVLCEVLARVIYTHMDPRYHCKTMELLQYSLETYLTALDMHTQATATKQ